MADEESQDDGLQDLPDADATSEARARRARGVAGGVFIAIGLLGVAVFFLHAEWRLRWLVLLIGVFSIGRGVAHLAGLLRAPRDRDVEL